MDEISGLKFYSLCVHTYITKNFIEIPPCAKKVIFSTEFVLLDLNPHFYEVNQEVWKRPCAWRNFKNIFCVLSTCPKRPFRKEKPSIFNFRYVKEVWASGLLGVKNSSVTCSRTFYLDDTDSESDHIVKDTHCIYLCCKIRWPPKFQKCDFTFHF